MMPKRWVILRNSPRNLPDFLHLYATQYILLRIFKDYLATLLIFLLMNVFYLWQRQFLKWIWMNLFIGGFLLIHNLIYYAGGSAIEMDKNLMVMNFFVFLPFVQDVLVRVSLNLRKAFLILAFLFAAVLIVHQSWRYRERIHYLKSLTEVLEREPGRKFYTWSDNIDSERVMFTWSIPVETLLMSSLDGPQHSATLYVFPGKEDLPDYIQYPDLFLCVTFWEEWNVHDLNTRYFVLPEEPYRYIEHRLNGF